MNNEYNPRSIGQTLAAIACTIVFSTMCIVGTIAPAQANAATIVHQIAAHA